MARPRHSREVRKLTMAGAAFGLSESRSHAEPRARFARSGIRSRLSQHANGGQGADPTLLYHECASDDRAKNLQEHHDSVLLESGTSERQLLSQLNQLLQVASASAAVH